MTSVGWATDWSRQRVADKVPNDNDLALWHASIQECRASSVRILLVAEFFIGWLIAVPFLDLWPKVPAGLGWAAIWLILGAGASFVALRARYTLAAVTLVGSLFISSAIAFRAVDTALTICSFALVVGAAAVVLGPNWTRGVAIAATVWLLFSTRGTTVLDDGMVFSSIALLWAVMFLTWLGHRPLKQSLEWAMSSHLDARKRAEEAERHRGELGRVVKSLTETHERLEHLTAELDRARLAAENARSLKAKFAAYISHELRTPLNLIIGFSEMMVLAPHTYGDAVLPPAYRGDINAIYQSARHLATLINDVLDLSQIDAHRMALDRDDVPVREVIEEAVSTVEAAYTEKGLCLQVAVDDGLPVLYIDRTRIRQVLLNLLGNALRFTERGGVTISALRDRRDVLVSVADTGRGIPAADLPRLFDDFRQAEQPESEAGEGSGLGLAIARRFVALHGGWIKADSECGRGTRITFALPASHTFVDALPSQTDGDYETAQSRSSNLPIVAVDGDDPWLLRTSQRYLDGYRIVSADPAALSDEGVRGDGLSAVILSAPSDGDGWERLRAMTDANTT
ncbi:MAG TPA: HAMP domain-containing sensor histidine kinase, partial [Chloroflexota bacterium]|nr:HAMP domain-containing sensor histidine kinase [Chloroflexota bacterium]